MQFLATLFVRHRLLVVLVVGAMTCAALAQFPRLEFDEDPRTLFRTRDAEYDRLLDLFEDFGRDDLECLVVLQGDDFLTDSAVRSVRQLTEGVESLAGVDQVFSMLSVRRPVRLRSYFLPLIPPYDAATNRVWERARREADNHPLLQAMLLSPDRKTAVVYITVAEDHADISAVRQVVDQIRTQMDRSIDPAEIEATLTGLPVLRLEHLQAMRRDQVVFNLIGIALATLVAGLLFREVASVVVVMTGPAIGVIWTMGALSAFGEPINLLNNVIPPILMVIGLANAIHFLFEFKTRRAAGDDRLEATRNSIIKVGPACALASLTTGVGFGSLALATADMIRNFGLGAALGCGMSFLATVTIVPAMTSSWLGQAVSPVQETRERPLQRWWLYLLFLIEGQPRRVAIAGILGTGLLALSVFGLRADNRLTESIPPEDPGYHALLKVDRTFGGSMPGFVVVEWPADRRINSSETVEVLRAVDRCLAEASFSTPISLVTLLESISPADSKMAENFHLLRYVPVEQIERFLVRNGRKTVVRFRVADVGAAALESDFEMLRLELHQLQTQHPGYQLSVTGTPVVAFRNTRFIIEALYRSLALAALVVFATVTVFCGSIRMGLVSVVPNAFPLATTSAALWAMGGELQIASVVVFSVCLGIATDDTIHFLARFQRERREKADFRRAVRLTFLHLSRVMSITTLVIATGFAGVLFSNQPSLQLFSKLAMLALCSALVGDLVILPALLYTFAGKSNSQS